MQKFCVIINEEKLSSLCHVKCSMYIYQYQYNHAEKKLDLDNMLITAIDKYIKLKTDILLFLNN